MTTLASTSRTSQSRKSVVVTLLVTPRTTKLSTCRLKFRINSCTVLPRLPSPSTPRLSSSTTLVKLVLVTLQSWIATLPTLPASSLRSWRRLIVVPASPLRTPPSSSSLVMLLSSRWFHPSPCVLRPSLTTLLLDVSLSVICVKPLLLVSSSLLRNPTSKARSPRQLSRPPRANKRTKVHFPIPKCQDMRGFVMVERWMGWWKERIDSFALRRMETIF